MKINYFQTDDFVKQTILSNDCQTDDFVKRLSNRRFCQTDDFVKQQKLAENKFIFKSSIYFYTYIFRNIILTLSHSKLKKPIFNK